MSGEFITSQSQDKAATAGDNGRRFYLTREPVILTVLSVLALAFFLAVTGLSHVFAAQQKSLGARWFTRGARDLKKKRFQTAVSELRTALLYSRNDYSYQFNLAEALLGEGTKPLPICSTCGNGSLRMGG